MADKLALPKGLVPDEVQTNSELRYKWVLEICRYIFAHPNKKVAEVAKDFGRSTAWFNELRRTEEWERAWVASFRETFMPAIPLAAQRVLDALTQDDVVSVNLAVRVLENAGLMRPEEEQYSDRSAFPSFVEVEVLPVPQEPKAELVQKPSPFPE